MTRNPLNWSFRIHCLLGALACGGLLAYALYVEHGMLMQPCPLCILQRIAFLAVGLVCLVGAIHGPRRAGVRAVYGVLAAISAIVGAAIAAWHVRMQLLPPDEVPSCGGMELGYMVKAFPLRTVIDKVFTGSGDCAKIDWTFLGVSMPGWTLLCFVLLATAALYAGFRRR
ncbi:MAG: disulfide bond formation protein B [Lysobacteraceae bacterium]